VDKMRTNKPQLPYDDHERALKLLHALDRRVWEVKVSAILESANYETLTEDELYSKLKSIEIDHQTQAKLDNPSAQTMALVTGTGSSSSLTNTSQPLFALSSLASVSKEQLEVLGDDELALVINRLSWFHNNRMNRRRGGQKEGCFGCGGLDHFIVHCPNKDKHQSTKPKDKREYTYAKHKDKREYTSNKHKSKGKLDKEALKKAKIRAHAFLSSLSDIDADSDEHESSSSDDESEKKIME